MKTLKLILGILATLAFAGNAGAQLIDTDHVVNVQFGMGTSGGGVNMNGTTWSSTVAPLQYKGTVWTDDSPTNSGRFISATNLPYADSTQGSSTIGFSFSSGITTGSWSGTELSANLTLLQSCVIANTSQTLTISGLDNSKTYTLALASYFYLWSTYTGSTTTFTVNGTTLSAAAGSNPSANLSAWVAGRNYVQFNGIAPVSGNIVITISMTSGTDWGLNGFQIAPDTTVHGAAYDEFVGPFASWINVKNAPYNAKGDGVTDDTAAIQSALNNVGTSGYGSVVYFPAGTYLISEGANNGNPLNITNGIRCGLVLASKQHVAIIGQDPFTTKIKWNGSPTSTDAMLWANGVTESRFGRITWDGSGSTVTGWAHMQNWVSNPNYASTAIFRSDEFFENMNVGIALGTENTDYGKSDGDNNIIRDHFFNCTQAGIRTGSYNAFQNYVWDSEFVNCGTGVDNLGNGSIGGGNFNVYRCYFNHSSVADLHVLYAFWFDFQGNTSVGSKKFFLNDGGAQTGNQLIFQNNKILDSTDSNTIVVYETGNVLLLNNQIRSLSTAVAPIVQMGYGSLNGPDLNSVNNTYTVQNPITVSGNTYSSPNPPGAPRWWTQGDQVVSISSISSTVPTMPGTPANLGRPTTDLTGTITETTITNAITWAGGYVGQHPVVHIPAGSYAINSTITIPAGLDVQLVGDDGMATNFNWSGSTGGTLLQLTGPSKAWISDINFNGGQTAGNAISITDPDQVGAKIYIDGGYWQQFTQYGLYVDGCQNAVVECHAFEASGGTVTNASRIVNVVGSGESGNAYTAIFGSDAAVNFASGTLFQVTNYGNLVVADHYYEGITPRVIQLAGNSTVSFSDDVYQIYSGAVENPPIELDTFTGTASFINYYINRNWDTATDPQILINGETSSTQALFLGTDVATGASSFTNYFSRPGSGGTVSLLNSKYSVTAGSYQVSDAGDTRTSGFITSTLNELSTILPTFPATSGTGITEVRLIDVNISGGATNCVQVGP